MVYKLLIYPPKLFLAVKKKGKGCEFPSTLLLKPSNPIAKKERYFPMFSQGWSLLHGTLALDILSTLKAVQGGFTVGNVEKE